MIDTLDGAGEGDQLWRRFGDRHRRAMAIVVGPLHERVTATFDSDAHRRLVSTNWIRTFAWTTRPRSSL